MGCCGSKAKIPFLELDQKIKKITSTDYSTEDKMSQLLQLLETYLLERCKDFLASRCEQEDQNNTGLIKYTSLEKLVQRVFIFPTSFYDESLKPPITESEVNYYQFLRYLSVNPLFAEEQNVPPHCKCKYLCLQLGNPLLYADFIMSLTIEVEKEDDERSPIRIGDMEIPVTHLERLIISQIPVIAKTTDYDYLWSDIQKEVF